MTTPVTIKPALLRSLSSLSFSTLPLRLPGKGYCTASLCFPFFYTTVMNAVIRKAIAIKPNVALLQMRALVPWGLFTTEAFPTKYFQLKGGACPVHLSQLMAFLKLYASL